MSEELNPSPDQAREGNVTEGNESISGDPGASVEDPPQHSREDLETWWKASNKEGKRLAGELQNSQAATMQVMSQNQNLLNQIEQARAAQPAYPTQEALPEEGLSGNEMEELNQARLTQDMPTIQRLEAVQRERDKAAVKKELLSESYSRQSANTRRQSSVKYLNDIPQMSDPNHPFFQKTLEKYKQMKFDPSYNWVEEDEMEISPGQSFNPHLMRLAAMEIRGSFANDRASAAAQSAGSEYFTEGNEGATQTQTHVSSGTKGKATDYTKLLTTDEISYSVKMSKHDPSWTLEKHFKSLRPHDQKVRIAGAK
jgi:hypothetical protein